MKVSTKRNIKLKTFVKSKEILMMKKSLANIGLISALLLTGLTTTTGLTQAVSQTPRTVLAAKTECKTYDNLSKADQKKVGVKYSTTKDGSKYDVNAKFENKTNKTVKVNLKDVYIYNKDGSKIKSAKTNTVTLKPKATCDVKKLFTKVSASTLKSKKDCIIYKDAKHKLGTYSFKL